VRSLATRGNRNPLFSSNNGIKRNPTIENARGSDLHAHLVVKLMGAERAGRLAVGTVDDFDHLAAKRERDGLLVEGVSLAALGIALAMVNTGNGIDASRNVNTKIGAGQKVSRLIW